ncbi:hypothetical protein NIES4072_14890 [Nostoc commune NIES-4072]|uniref:Uncharacterized protein n=1 Tax=Nostoc commune NIES-4072 TaxID=2005467 RepID=A0A2R5FGT7_NOSCO|nr:hypothetical protein NIES4070_11920 [Nostoc commune HK-02]GBG17827.1 hypothetical protein NIES4072_14890 [Nostoc commune NIES-4072]
MALHRLAKINSRFGIADFFLRRYFKSIIANIKTLETTPFPIKELGYKAAFYPSSVTFREGDG